jgi:2-oxoglutarate dehydrogenase E1 component
MVSNLTELDKGTSFQQILDEADSKIKPNTVKRVIFCSGKVYYHLLEMRLAQNITDIVIIRVEQLYPFAKNIAMEILSKYSKASEFIWCQEEPQNMGAWSFINSYLNDCLQEIAINNQFKYVGRQVAASPAVGYLHLHNKQQEKLVKEALKIGE